MYGIDVCVMYVCMKMKIVKVGYEIIIITIIPSIDKQGLNALHGGPLLRASEDEGSVPA